MLFVHYLLCALWLFSLRGVHCCGRRYEGLASRVVYSKELSLNVFFDKSNES